MAEIVNSLPGIAPVLPIAAIPGVAVTGTNPIVAAAPSDTRSETMGEAGVRDPADFFEMDVLLERVSISNTDGFPVPNVSFPDFDPMKAWLAHPLVQSRLRGFQHLRADFVLTVVMTCPGSCYGAYCVSALCEGGMRASTDLYYVDSYTDSCLETAVQDEFAFLNCEMQNTVQLDLPFVHQLDAIPIVGTFRPSWRIRLFTFTPLQSTISATATGTLLFYGRLKKGFTLETRVYQSGRERFPVPKKAPQQGRVGAIASKLSRAVGVVTSVVPSIAPFSAPIGAGLAALSSVADIFGFTKDASPRVPEPFVARLVSNTVTVDGEDVSEPLALFNGNAVTVDSGVADGVSEDLMSFSSLFKRWTYIQSTTITAATPVGNLNLPMAVHPFIYSAANYVVYPVGGYVGLPFEYWSGSMEYLIYIPSSTNFKGSLSVFWSKDGVLPPSDPTPWLDGVMIDLCGSSKTLIRVDMSANDPVRVKKPRTAAAAVSSDKSTNGYLRFYVTSPLTSPRVAAPLTFHVFARCAENMRFGVPTVFPATEGDDNDLRAIVNQYQVYQSGVEIDPAVSEDRVVLSKGVADFPVNSVMFGEDVASVRALVQRFSWIGDQKLTNETSVVSPPAWFSPSFPPLASVTWDGGTDPYAFNILPLLGAQKGYETWPIPWTWAGHYFNMYTGARGSHRVKVYQKTSSGFVSKELAVVAASSRSIAVLNTNNGNASSFDSWRRNISYMGSSAVELPIAAGSHAVEVLVPYYSSAKLTPCGRRLALPSSTSNPANGQSTNGQAIFFWADSSSEAGAETVTYSVHVAAGPDVSVGRFRRTPRLSKTV
jgi:hypothetical protein